MAATKKSNEDRIGAGKFWAWQSRGASAAVNFIVLSFMMFFATDTLGMPAALAGTLLMVSGLVDAFSDPMMGLWVDRTKTRFGKGRPYEFAILGLWVSTWLLFSAPVDASLVVQSVWVLVTLIIARAVCTALLSACQNVYMVRAFPTDGQRNKLASFGGIVIMLASVSVSIMFPILLSNIDTMPGGWSGLVAIFAIPFGLIGILRFVFVKEIIELPEDRDGKQKASLKDISLLLKTNPYVYMVSFMWLILSLFTAVGIAPFFFEWVVGDIAYQGAASAIALVALPLLFFFPAMMKRLPKGKLVAIGCIMFMIHGALILASGGEMSIVLVSFIFAGFGSLPLTYLTDLLLIDCGSYNEYKGNKRMDGTIGTLRGFVGKISQSIGGVILGFGLSLGGYDGTLAYQTESAIQAINMMMGLLPMIVFAPVAIVFMWFYKLDKLMPEIHAHNKAKREGASQ